LYQHLQKKLVMAKYIFKQDLKTGTYVPQGQGRPSVMVLFKKGDIIEGTFITVEGQSESDFVETQTPLGKVRIPFSGRIGSVITAYSQTSTPANDGSELKKSATESTNFFTPKNILISVLAISAFFGLLKVTKVI